MNRGPFHRAMALAAAIASIMSNAATAHNIAARKEALADLSPYQSRGKGRGLHSSTRLAGPSCAQVKRDARKRRNQLRNKLAHRG